MRQKPDSVGLAREDGDQVTVTHLESRDAETDWGGFGSRAEGTC